MVSNEGDLMIQYQTTHLVSYLSCNVFVEYIYIKFVYVYSKILEHFLYIKSNRSLITKVK